MAAGLLVGIVIVTALLRLKFYFTPPKDGTASSLTSYFSGAVLSSIKPPPDSIIDLANVAEDATTTKPATLAATPTSSIQTVLTLDTTHDLVTGIAPQLVAVADHYLLGFLVGQRYVIKAYDVNWQPLSTGDTTLTDDISLINGALPVTALHSTTEGLYLLYTKALSDDPEHMAVYVKHYDAANPGVVQATYTLLSDVAVDDTLTAALGDDVAAMAITTPATNTTHLKLFSLAGQLLAEPTLTDVGTIRALLPDQAAVIVVSTLPNTVRFTKFSNLGVLQQTVNLTLPEADQVLAVQRLGDLLALRTASALMLLSDNLQTRYPAIPLTPDQLYPYVLVYDQHVLLLYNTATSLTDYTIHSVDFHFDGKE